MRKLKYFKASANSMAHAKQQLSALGFNGWIGNWGQQTAESYDTGRDHFTPKFRDVFIGKAVGGYYVTSHIKGTMRRWHCRQSQEASIANIFGQGKSIVAAVKDFAANFTAKTYNVTA